MGETPGRHHRGSRRLFCAPYPLPSTPNGSANTSSLLFHSPFPSPSPSLSPNRPWASSTSTHAIPLWTVSLTHIYIRSLAFLSLSLDSTLDADHADHRVFDVACSDVLAYSVPRDSIYMKMADLREAMTPGVQYDDVSSHLIPTSHN